MDIYDIDKLKRNDKQNNLYDFFVTTFSKPRNLNLPTTVVREENYMRMDLVSRDSFASDAFLDLVCNLNEIDNPLNIMGGDVILVTNAESSNLFRVDEVGIQDIPKNLVDNSKTTKIDPNRKNYVEQNYSSTPTMNPTPTDPVRANKDVISIGG